MSTPATATRCRSAAARSTCRSATSCRSRRSARPCRNGMEIARRKLRGEWSNGMLCSRARARPRRRRRAASSSSATAIGRGTPLRDALGIRDRRALRPRDQPEPARRDVGRRRRPRSRRALPRAVLAAVARSQRIADPGRRSRRSPPSRSSIRTAAAGSPHASCRASTRRPSRPSMIVEPADAARHAPDQQRRRRLELRDARARAAVAPVRPRARGRWRLPRPSGTRRRDARRRSTAWSAR